MGDPAGNPAGGVCGWPSQVRAGRRETCRAGGSGKFDRPLEPDVPRGARTRTRQAAARPRADDTATYLAVQPLAPRGTAGAARTLSGLQPAPAREAAAR